MKTVKFLLKKGMLVTLISDLIDILKITIPRNDFFMSVISK